MAQMSEKNKMIGAACRTAGRAAAAMALAFGISALCAHSAQAETPGRTNGPENVFVSNIRLNDHDVNPWINYGSGYIQTPSLVGEDADKYPELVQSLEAFSEGYRKDMTQMFDEWCEAARQDRKQYDNNFQAKVETQVYVRRADEKFFSFLEYQYTYSGGVHGYYCMLGNTFRTDTGEKVALHDLMTDDVLLRSVLKEKLEAKFPGSTAGTLGTSLDDYAIQGGEYDYNWVLGPWGITFIFNPYEIASYADGILNARIGYEEVPGLFTEDPGVLTGGWSCQLTGMMDEETDLDDDGVFETFSIGFDSFGVEQYDSLTVSDGNGTCSFEDAPCYYSAKPLLWRTEDGRSYVYIQLTCENDYRVLAVADVTGGKTPEAEKILDLGLLTVFLDDDNTGNYVPQDPACFILSSRMDILSNIYTGSKLYEMDEQGLPSPLEDYYTAHMPYSLHTVRELPARSVDLQTLEAGESILVPPGEDLTLVRTDGETWVDLERPDGSQARVEVDTSKWPRTINGEPEGAFFDRLYYAG